MKIKEQAQAAGEEALMYLSKIEIENYRTFRHLEMTFHERVNYLVGDNNIGKSNFLDLLQTTLSGQGFRESDFLDADQPIRVIYTLSTGDTGQEETGRIKLTQYVHEAAPKLENEDTGEPLPLEYIRRMYYISQSMPEAMQRENAASVTEEVRELFEACFLLTGEERAQLEAAFAQAGITVDISGSCETAALRLMHAIFSEQRRGAGRSTMQLLFAAGTYILAKLYQKKKSRAVPFEELVMTDRKGKRYLPVLVSIDEPEQHLHPYMQRAVLSFLQRILNNREPFFVHLLQKVLGIDGLDGQIFVVTHSADALINDYRTIIRLYWSEAQEVRAACGAAFHFDQEIEKHLIMHFPEVKEALYARCVLLVEGETEYGSFEHFARTLKADFDYHGICLINARGESSIGKIAQLMRRFHVPAVCFYDRDVMDGKKPSPYVFYTDAICYEMDVVDACLALNRRKVLDQVIRDTGEPSTYVSSALVKRAVQKLALQRFSNRPRKLENISGRDEKALQFYYFAWLYGNKGVIIGRSLGLHLTAEEIPSSFRRVIRAAVAFAEGSGGREKETI